MLVHECLPLIIRISRLNFSVAHRPTANLLHICLFLPCLLDFAVQELVSEPFLRQDAAHRIVSYDLEGPGAPLLRHFAVEIPPDGLGTCLAVASAVLRLPVEAQPDVWPAFFDAAADSVSSIGLLPGDAWTVGADRIVFAVFPQLRHFASSSSLVPNGVHPPIEDADNSVVRAGHLFGGPLAPL